MSPSVTVEYAKSGRAACRACRGKINNADVRIEYKVDYENGSYSGAL